jgi:integrase
VFTSRERRPLNRNYINIQVWKKALRTAGVEPSRTNGMHALRHYCASALLEAGVSIRAVSEYLGHADPGFTLRIYAHLMPTSDERARQAMDLALGVPSQDHADLVRTDRGSQR